VTLIKLLGHRFLLLTLPFHNHSSNQMDFNKHLCTSALSWWRVRVRQAQAASRGFSPRWRASTSTTRRGNSQRRENLAVDVAFPKQRGRCNSIVVSTTRCFRSCHTWPGHPHRPRI
jgi:hypothetical protein